MEANTQEIKEIENILIGLFNKPKCLTYELENAKILIAKWKRLTNWVDATCSPILLDVN
jgi:hypothetical protein